MKIKVTAYIDSEALHPDEYDSNDPTGLPEEAFLAFTTGQREMPLEDLDFALIED